MGEPNNAVSHYFLDFDDTLAAGSITWSIQSGFPKLVEKYNLFLDTERFREAMQVAQEKATYISDYNAVLGDLFLQMEWPLELRDSLLADLVESYKPQLFDDTIEFLERLKRTGRPIIVISNHPNTPEVAEHLGVARFFTRIFTPKLCGGCKPKPHTELWGHVLRYFSDVDIAHSVMIGDDPWSDGAFAQQIGLPCWILDRSNFFSSMGGNVPYYWAKSLAAIPVGEK